MQRFVFSFLILFSSFSYSQQLIDGVAAIVGEKAILYSEVIQIAQLFSMQSNIPQYSQPEFQQQLQMKALEELINQQVLLEYARQETIVVEDRNVELQLEQSLKNIELQYGSLQKAAEVFGVDRHKIKSYYEDQIRNNLLIERVKFELFNDIRVSRREVEQFYSTWKDSFPDKNPQVDFSIVSLPIKVSENKIQATRQKLEAIKQDISSGIISFSEAAKQFSQDPGSAANGGNLGLVGRGVFVKPFEEAAFSLEVGELSDIVETQFGFHLLKVDEKYPDRINVSHILLTPVPDDEDKKKTMDKLTDIRERILSGETSIEEQVDILSDDDFIRSQKGRMGLTDISLLPAEFQPLLLSIPLNELSYPVFSSDQYHIIIVHQRIPGGKVNLKDHWHEIESMALDFKKRDRYDSWIKDQRARMYIQVKI